MTNDNNINKYNAMNNYKQYISHYGFLSIDPYGAA